MKPVPTTSARRAARFLLAVLCGCGCAVSVFAAKPALTDLKVFPADVNLTTRGDRQSIVVQAIYADGVTRDVTAQASFTLAHQALAKFDHFVLSPLADGQTDKA